MRYARPRTIITACAVTAMLLSGCSGQAGVQRGAPEGAAIADTTLTRDTSLPTYLLVVDPIVFNLDSYNSWCLRYVGPEALMNAALINALVNTGNFSVVERVHTGGQSINPRAGEKGPFFVRLAPSEFSHSVERSESSIGKYNRDDDDSILETVGKFAFALPGFWITQATGLPTAWNSYEAQGVIGFDVSVLDEREQEVIASFPARGTFTAKSKEIGDTMAGYHSREQVSSPVESAVRAAMVDVSRKLLSELSKRYPTA